MQPLSMSSPVVAQGFPWRSGPVVQGEQLSEHKVKCLLYYPLLPRDD